MSIIVNSRISFVFALMKCSFAALGEQNKIDNDSKCQQVYKSQKKCKLSQKVHFFLVQNRTCDLLGVEVDENYKGIVIKNGQKTIQ